MNRLKPRHERFCIAFVECANAALAARAAGYAPGSARNAGYRLLRQPRIVSRIADIQKETAHAHCRNVDVLLGKLETIYRRAVDDHHFAAAARAVELQAKLSGVAPTTASSRAAPTAKAPPRPTKRATGCEDGGEPIEPAPPEIPSGAE